MSSKVYDYETVMGFKHMKFLRTFGVSKDIFVQLLGLVTDWHKKMAAHKKGGHPFSLTAYDYLAITLLYMRQYHTMDSLADEWGVSKGTICKVYNKTITALVSSGELRFEGKKELKDGDVVVVDATESPINRPKHRQKRFYSGKKKRHTMKTQILYCKSLNKILEICLKQGHVHDYSVYKESKATKLPDDVLVIGDSGYQGLGKVHANSKTPFKKPRGGRLSKEQKAANRKLNKERICIEHVNSWIKRFRILKDRYRNRRSNFWKPMFIACVIFNLACPNV